jgi:hypothetical protein
MIDQVTTGAGLVTGRTTIPEGASVHAMVGTTQCPSRRTSATAIVPCVTPGIESGRAPELLDEVVPVAGCGVGRCTARLRVPRASNCRDFHAGGGTRTPDTRIMIPLL